MDSNAPIMLRSPDRLERGMVVRLIPDAPAELVRHTRLVRGRWMVRTTTNLHRCPAELLVEVLAWSVPGIGYVTAEAVA